MKFTFKKRFSLTITLVACAAMIAMLYFRFGLTRSAIVEYALHIFLLCIALLLIAAGVAAILNLISNKNDKFDE